MASASRLLIVKSRVLRSVDKLKQRIESWKITAGYISSEDIRQAEQNGLKPKGFNVSTRKNQNLRILICLMTALFLCHERVQ